MTDGWMDWLSPPSSSASPLRSFLQDLPGDDGCKGQTFRPGGQKKRVGPACDALSQASAVQKKKKKWLLLRGLGHIRPVNLTKTIRNPFSPIVDPSREADLPREAEKELPLSFPG